MPDLFATSFGCFGPVAIFLVIYLLACLKVVNEYERLVIFTLGKVQDKPTGPGLCFVWRPFQTSVTVSLRTVVMDVPSQDIITRDNVSLKVSAVVYFKVLDPTAAIVGVENYYYATSQMAQTTLRSILGEVTLDELLADREKLSQRL
ncbi:MAG TPA: SPFH domain-containing protein, partial [Geothrix sp.]|nr:SPFH domain-containing protein [Geothrix sp.]